MLNTHNVNVIKEFQESMIYKKDKIMQVLELLISLQRPSKDSFYFYMFYFI